MREVVFHVLAERPGHLEARAKELPLPIAAATLEELQHEAREALIEHFGPAHCTYRVRIRRHPQPVPARSLTLAEMPLPLSAACR
ncbi:MAG: hypothetical protein KFB97_12575 [Cyanobium sp. M30B3]|nr:MAG: hypothetical protein KFB97_12575 [Cyanobium sp. M30B3]